MDKFNFRELGKTFGCACIALTTFGVTAFAQEPLKLKGHGTWAQLSQFKDYEQPFWSQKIAAETEGRVQVDYTAFDTAGLKGPEIVRLMKLGTLDLGTTVLSYISNEDPITEGVDLAGALADAASARKAADLYQPIIASHLDKKYDIRVLGLVPYPAQMLFCKGPISNLDGLKGKKVRVSLRTTSDLIEAYGAITVNLPFNEVYGKLKDGSIDCLVTGTLPAHTAKFYEVSSSLYVIPLGWSMMMASISNASWERIQAKDQTVILKGVATLSDQLWAAAEKQTELGIACNAGAAACSLPNKGAIKLVQPTDVDKAKLREMVSRVVVKRWAERCGAECEKQWYNTIGKIAGIAPR
jgi:TRAP-type C4-dicarboxylate transport system substrate-binding protein